MRLLPLLSLAATVNASPIILLPPTGNNAPVAPTAVARAAAVRASTERVTPLPTGFFILVAYTNGELCLGADALDGAPARLLPCTDPRTKFRRAGTALELRNGMCLDATDGNGSALQAWTCVGNENQGFGWVRERTTEATWDNITWDGKCVHVHDVVAGEEAGLAECEGGLGERWIALDSATGF